MKIEFKKVLDIISKKTGIAKKDLTISASFDAVDVDAGKNCPDWIAKDACVTEFKEGYSNGLEVNIFAYGYKIFGFCAQDITPKTNDIYELMRVGYVSSCIGPGFYQYSPYLILDKICDSENIKKFIEALSFDTNKTKVSFHTNSSNCNYDLTKEHKKFLRTLPTYSIKKSFFKDIDKEFDKVI